MSPEDKAEMDASIARMNKAQKEGRVALIVDPRVLSKLRLENPELKKEIVFASPVLKRIKFRKVYKGPGYPTDPANDVARAIDAYVNAFNPQPHGVFDRSALNHWLVENIN